MLDRRSSKHQWSVAELHQIDVGIQFGGDTRIVDDALNQIQHYTFDIAQLFDYNALVVVSDGVNSLRGTPHCTDTVGASVWPASAEWYAPWKSIDGFDVEPTTTGSMKTLLEGLFPPDRLLPYVRDFIVFEVANDKITKKGAKYHQFFAVRLAADKTLATYRAAQADRRIGVIWHTTGSGKSLSMVFLVGILRHHPDLHNPVFVIEVDRTDLDNQLSDQFLAARSLVGDVQQADDVDHLRDLLQTEGGAVILTTIEKFRLRPGEIDHPELSTCRNLILIADEAHRSQYGFKEGFARNLAEALPNALRLGFTGTPISLSGADTVAVFGDVIHTYDIEQSQRDHATVKIYYEPRLIKLHLKKADVDAALLDRLRDTPLNADEIERRKRNWSALAAAARTTDRLTTLARDLLDHFRERTATLKGKAMIVCMERANCVKLLEALTVLPDCPEIKIVMTGNLADDPPAWSQRGYLTTKAQREAIKKRMIDPDDPLQMVIVCDMWLTGTDIPYLHTLYIDKPMQGHNMIQAISRVNRVFRDKPHGLIVDYIGIGDDLREATARYTQGGGKGDPAPDLQATARPIFLQALDDLHATLPSPPSLRASSPSAPPLRGQGVAKQSPQPSSLRALSAKQSPASDEIASARKDAPRNDATIYGQWRRMSLVDIEDLYAFVYGYLAADDMRRDQFLQAEARLSAAYLLVKHLDDCRPYADEVIFYQRTRKQIMKTVPGRKPQRDIEQSVRDLVDDSVASDGVVDIFKTAGLERADVSILDDNFLQTYKDRPYEDLRLKLLQRLLADAIEAYRKRNPFKAQSFKELLEATLQKYHNRLIDAAAVIQAMIAIKHDQEQDQQRAQDLGLAPDELAFYDVVATNYLNLYNEAFLRDLIHDIVQTIKRNLKVDWTQPHREDVKAAVRAAVRRVLRRRNVREEDFEPFLGYILVQAEALYADWPLGEYTMVESSIPTTTSHS